MTRRIVLCDADNTLWDTDAVFAEAQIMLLRRVEEALGIQESEDRNLDFVRQYDQSLAAKHHLHFRYPPIMLVFALAEGLLGVAADAAAVAALTGNRSVHTISISHAEQMVSDYSVVLERIPALLPGVEEGLRLAQKAKLDVYVLTEGRVERQRRIIQVHRIESAFDGVLEITKSANQFRRLRERFSFASVVVIGDQPDRDISPALAAGCSAVLVPSRFRPAWYKPDSCAGANYIARDFHDAIVWIAEMLESN